MEKYTSIFKENISIDIDILNNNLEKFIKLLLSKLNNFEFKNKGPLTNFSFEKYDGDKTIEIYLTLDKGKYFLITEVYFDNEFLDNEFSNKTKIEINDNFSNYKIIFSNILKVIKKYELSGY